MSQISDIEKHRDVILQLQNLLLEVVDRGSETQIQVFKKINLIVQIG